MNSHENIILQEARLYRAERLKMNNPKGYVHIERVARNALAHGAFITNSFERILPTDPQATQALEILSRLARLDSLNRIS